MKEQIRDVRYFLFGQHFSDGVRITLAIVIPSVVLAQFGQFDTGLTLSLGALCASIVDSPGPVAHKRNGMLACCGFITLVAVVTGFARMNTWLLGTEILLFSFFFSMFGVFGTRATSVGSAALLVMILMMDRPLEPAAVWRNASLVLAGGLWYTLISLSFFRVLPYRAAQQALGECIHAIAKFLMIKAEFYETQTDLDKDYRRLVAQQVVVNEKQDAVREILFKSRQIVQDSTPMGRRLVLTFVDVMDLYEQIVGFYYDYKALRERFGQTAVLHSIARLIRRMAIELDYIGLAIQANRPRRSNLDLRAEIEQLVEQINQVSTLDYEGSTLVLKKIVVSLRNVDQRLTTILNYTTRSAENEEATLDVDYDRFISHQQVSLSVLRTNMTLNSSIFRHSVRMALACLTGFFVAKLIAFGYHSYWILLTITVIIKPAYSLSKQRNIERLVGTLIGGAIGVGLLFAIPDRTALFFCMLVLMVGAFSFQRTNYIVMVVLITPYVLILFSFLGAGGIGVAEERVLDTFIGSVIAFAASYFLFPRWESQQLKEYLSDVLRANLAYLLKLADGLSGKSIAVTDYKLARKDVYVSSANLTAAFQRMTSEPRSKQWHQNEVQEFVVLNHILSANVATIASSLINEGNLYDNTIENLRLVRRALVQLEESLKMLDSKYIKPQTEPDTVEHSQLTKPEPTADGQLLKSQLEFIQKVSYDIGKLTRALVG